LDLDAGGVRGSESRFFLPQPTDVLAIRIRFAAAENVEPSGLTVYVRLPGEKGVRSAEVAAVQPNFLQPENKQPVLASVDGPIDEVRIASAGGKTLTLTEVVL